MEQIEDEESFEFGDNPDSWQMKVHSTFGKWLPFPSPFPLPWLLIAAPLLVAGCVIGHYYEQNRESTLYFAIKFGLVAALTNAVVYFEMLVDEVADTFPYLLTRKKEDVKTLFREWYKQTFWSRTDMIAGAVLGASLVGVCILAEPAFLESTVGRVYNYGTGFIVGFLGGSMLWAMFRIARFMSSLGKEVEIKPSVFDAGTSPLRTASALLWKVAFTAIAIYVLGISPLILCLVERRLWVMALVITFGAVFVLYFIIPQWNIHKTLLKLKQKRFRNLAQQIDNAFDKMTANPTSANIRQLRSLFDVQRQVNRRSSWSFGMTELLTLLGSVIVPLLILLISSAAKTDKPKPSAPEKPPQEARKAHLTRLQSSLLIRPRHMSLE